VRQDGTQEIAGAFERKLRRRIALRIGGIGMGLEEQTVDADRRSGTGERRDEFRTSAALRTCRRLLDGSAWRRRSPEIPWPSS